MTDILNDGIFGEPTRGFDVTPPSSSHPSPSRGLQKATASEKVRVKSARPMNPLAKMAAYWRFLNHLNFQRYLREHGAYDDDL